MSKLTSLVTLDRSGPADASVGLVSLPVPRKLAGKLRVAHDHGAGHPVAWWKRHKLPRRELVSVVAPPKPGSSLPGGRASSLPDTLSLTTAAAKKRPASDRWQVTARISHEKLEYTPRSFANIAALRGVPYEETTHVEYAVDLAYTAPGAKSARTVSLQVGATKPDGTVAARGPFAWQNVQADRVWANEVCQAMRVGGVIYNGDTYLWADVFLMLFSNGVAHAAAHFTTTKLHIEGYDFQGLPAIMLSGAGVKAKAATLPADGDRFDFGAFTLNTADAASLSSEAYPARFESHHGGRELRWYPFSRTFNPQVADAPPLEWAAGMGRTVRFQFSLSDAAPAIARYRVPAWWYTQAGEPWPDQWLPAQGRMSAIAKSNVEQVQRDYFTRGRFDAGSAEFGNDGFIGSGFLRYAYLTGDNTAYRDGLDYCYYWADIAVDHRDYSVHQWLGGWPWKTCAYSKFRDVLMGWLETGDPYLLDAAENCAEQYWMWFRSNWPRNSIGRDAFEISGWAWLWRYTGSERAAERTIELVRMLLAVLVDRGAVGGQMGAGPHPGYHASLYMTGVAMVSLLEARAAANEAGDKAFIKTIDAHFERLHRHFMRSDVELFPSNLVKGREIRDEWKGVAWATNASRVYAELSRLGVLDEQGVHEALKRTREPSLPSIEEWASSNRMGDNLLQTWLHDAATLGATVTKDGKGVVIAPSVPPEMWPMIFPPEQTVATPWGDLRVTLDTSGATPALRFGAAKKFPVSVKIGKKIVKTNSGGAFE